MKIYVVEGKNDYAKIKSILPSAKIMVTGGIAIKTSFYDELIYLSKENEIVLLLDPDGPGEKIRKLIQSKIPTVRHVYVDKNQAVSKNKKKVGIEHMSKDDLLKVLDFEQSTSNDVSYTICDLHDYGLVGQKNSREKREFIGVYCKIGYGNAKTLLTKLNMHSVCRNTLEKAINEYENK